MQSLFDRNATITLPGFIVQKKWIAGNQVLQLGEIEHQQDGRLRTSTEKDVYEFLSKEGDLIYIVPPRIKTQKLKSHPAVRALSKINSLEDVNVTTPLRWVNTKPYPTTPPEILNTWTNSFSFQKEVPGKSLGLREPQLGAIHAIASHWTASNEPATIIMPTGTGKTDTMIAATVYCQCSHVLVIVPSSILREQLCSQFQRLGNLQKVGSLSRAVAFPRVALIKKALTKPSEAKDIVEGSNVIVATCSVLAHSTPQCRKKLVELCTHLFIDEAHHVSAPTWKAIKDEFTGKSILQFTATPFRQDKQPIEGKTIYNYSMGRAQKAGYFRKINLRTVEEAAESRADLALAKRAVEHLDGDVKNGLEHILLARTSSIDKAKKLLPLYDRIANRYSPVIIHSALSQSEQRARLNLLRTGRSRVVICVDMFGEGFDLPNLKIAALHEMQKSLPVMLQFVGRFTRGAQRVGDATVVANVYDPQVGKELQSLYAQDPDWNEILVRKSEGKIAKEIRLQELIQSFHGDLPKQVPLWNLRPGHSTIVFQTTCREWNPDEIRHTLTTDGNAWYGISYDSSIVAVVTAREHDVRWGRYREIKDRLWNLFLGYWNRTQDLLYLYASDYSAFPCTDIALAISNSTATPISGSRVFKVLSDLERPMVRNLGASKSGSIRFTMYFGPDVAVGLDAIERAESELNNLFAWGYVNGEQVTVGCSSRRGKVWAADGGTIAEWSDWCDSMGEKMRNDNVAESDVIRGFLRPQEMTVRPHLIPISIEWGERLLRNLDSRVILFFGKCEVDGGAVDINVLSHEDSGPIDISISTKDRKSVYELEISENEGTGSTFTYRHKIGAEIFVKIGRSGMVSLVEYFRTDAPVIYYNDGSFSYHNFFVDAPCAAAFSQSNFLIWGWAGTNIKAESEGVDRDSTTIQYKVIEELKGMFDIVYNDDDPGEAADVIALRQESDNEILVRLIHCKFSSSEKVGCRVGDFYQVCGQAQKSVRWKHNGFRKLVGHMKKRESEWKERGHSRFVKGEIGDLKRLLNIAKYSKVSYEMMIVQPGLSKMEVSEPVLHLLGTTELYIRKTANAKLWVVCSK